MGTYISRRMADENSTETPISTSSSGSDTDSESDNDRDMTQNYRSILHSLINSEVYMVTPGAMYVDDGPHYKIARADNSKLVGTEFTLMTKLSSDMMPNKRWNNKMNIVNMLYGRENGLYLNNNFSYAKKCNINNRYLPNEMSVLDGCRSKVFCGIFAKDGNRFITASQDHVIRIYDSSTVPYKFKHSIRARDVGWSIIDVAFSPDNQQFIYTTWSSSVHLCSVNDKNAIQEPLSLIKSGRRFCVFSATFSSDGKEILGGASDACLYIYNLQQHCRTLKIGAHAYDVNSVCFADASSHILYSGGDDGLVKVWDRRSLLESSPKPVGILAGHMDGITFIDSKGDGRHLISNSKDQSIRLWDIRMFSGCKAADNTLKAIHQQTWDYRWQEVPKKVFFSEAKIDGDTSIMRYRGHVVKKTLIRCRFSPIETTGQRYIYTGCGRGRVFIFDSLTGRIKEILTGHLDCVRDVYWHPTRNEILSSSWDGTVGRMTYVDKRALQEERSCVDSELSDKRSLRRSLRLARKKKKENTAYL